MYHSAAGPSTPAHSASDATLMDVGAIRSRTLLFQSYRDSAPRRRRFSFTSDGGYAAKGARPETLDAPNNETHQKGGGAYYDLTGELQQSLPPRWVDTTDEVDATLTALQSRIAHLDRLHAKHILPGFADRTDEEREIERETVEITKQFRRCSKLIATLAKNTQALAQTGQASAHELAMARNVQTTLATKVQDASGVFRRKQSNYMQRLRGHEERHHDVATTANHSSQASQNVYRPDSESAVREDIELSRQYLASSSSQQAQSQLLLDEEEALGPSEIDIRRRDREIDQIAKSIAELAELFQDLSSLVIDQGTMLDRIDFNIEHMGQDMHAAARELNEATRYQKRTSRGQCILLLVLLILLCIAIIIVKPFWRILFG